MNEPRCEGLPEELLSGYLDDELTQADEQRVRLHLEDCPRCRALLGELKTIREVAMTTKFEEPSPAEWGELPRGRASAAFRSLGWTVAVVWLVATTAYALWGLATSPEGFGARLLAFGGIAGMALLFVSVLIDRVRARRTDRYEGVQR
ncbi:MAG: anti-sigma factor family protein [Thermoanaerobaculia bacterium]